MIVIAVNLNFLIRFRTRGSTTTSPDERNLFATALVIVDLPAPGKPANSTIILFASFPTAFVSIFRIEPACIFVATQYLAQMRMVWDQELGKGTSWITGTSTVMTKCHDNLLIAAIDFKSDHQTCNLLIGSPLGSLRDP